MMVMMLEVLMMMVMMLEVLVMMVAREDWGERGDVRKG